MEQQVLQQKGRDERPSVTSRFDSPRSHSRPEPATPAEKPHPETSAHNPDPASAGTFGNNLNKFLRKDRSIENESRNLYDAPKDYSADR